MTAMGGSLPLAGEPARHIRGLRKRQERKPGKGLIFKVFAEAYWQIGCGESSVHRNVGLAPGRPPVGGISNF